MLYQGNIQAVSHPDINLTLAMSFRSILDVTNKEWLDGLKLREEDIPDAIILEGSWWRAERQQLRLSQLSNVRELGFPDIYWGEWAGKKVIFCMAYGAPRAVEISQIFASLGCKLVIQIGTCGGLQSHLQPGHIILPETIACEDGVAEHYVKDGSINASPHWIERAREHLQAQSRTCAYWPARDVFFAVCGNHGHVRKMA